MTNPLTTHTQTPQTLSEAQIAQLYALYQTYYGGTTPELFSRDLQEKDQILILQDNQTPIGFTTLKIIHNQHQNQPIRAIFSGDTIIHHQYWGSQTLPLAWCELVGKIQAQEPHIPLYWLLIVKGDRTYRYLNVFSKQYYPNRKTPPPPPLPTPARHRALSPIARTPQSPMAQQRRRPQPRSAVFRRKKPALPARRRTRLPRPAGCWQPQILRPARLFGRAGGATTGSLRSVAALRSENRQPHFQAASCHQGSLKAAFHVFRLPQTVKAA